MELIEFFGVQDACIIVEIPEIPDKQNYFYKPSSRLHKFDEGRVLLRYSDNTNIMLRKDALQEILTPFYILLIAGIKNKITLTENSCPRNVGFDVNTALWNNDNHQLLENHWLWSCTNDIQSFLYTHKKKIYLEIFPTYPWLSVDPENAEEWLSFADFMRTYQPYAVVTIPHDVACQWRDRLACLMHKLDIYHDPLEE